MQERSSVGRPPDAKAAAACLPIKGKEVTVAPRSDNPAGSEPAEDPDPKSPHRIRPGAQLPPALWTPRELAAHFKIHHKTLAAIVRKQRIPCLRIGTRLRFDPVEVRRWADARREGSR
jgi:hypothetical protein